MDKNSSRQYLKDHPVAIGIFSIYVIMWIISTTQLILRYQSNYSSHSNGVDYYPALVFLLSIIYFVAILFFRAFNPDHRRFYTELAMLVLAPVVVFILIAISEF